MADWRGSTGLAGIDGIGGFGGSMDPAAMMESRFTLCVTDGIQVGGGGGARPPENRSMPTPAWVTEYRSTFEAGAASFLIIHGNTRDLFPRVMGDGVQWCTGVSDYLISGMSPKRLVARYDLERGLRFSRGGNAVPAEDALIKLNALRLLSGREKLGTLPTTAEEFMQSLRDLATLGTEDGGVATVIDYFDMMVTNGDPTFMTDAAKTNLVVMQNLPADMIAGANFVIGVTGMIADVNSRLRETPYVEAVRVPLPDADLREFFLTHEVERLGKGANPLMMEMNVATLAEISAGLTLINLRRMLSTARLSGEPVTYPMVSSYKKKIIERECGDLIEFIDGGHDFSAVGGMDGALAELRRVAKAVREGKHELVPMGIMCVGAMGTGKTFIIEAMAKETGMVCISLKNFMNKFVGETERNLEKVLDLVESLGNVLFIIDEADRKLNGGGDGDGGVSSRVIARLKEFMSDKKHKGKVITVMMTNRPDQIDIDLKRRGRMDIKIPFFFPETKEARLDILQKTLKKYRLTLAEGADLTAIAEKAENYSAGELAGIIEKSNELAGETDRPKTVTAEQLQRAFRDVVPSRDERRLLLQELLAAFESSSNEMLPERYRGMDSGELQRMIDQVQSEIAVNTLRVR